MSVNWGAIMEEWSILDAYTLVRQGDLLISRDPGTGVIDEMCLVITADCDISKGKFGKQLACLRIIKYEEYVQSIWADRKLAKLVVNETKKILEKINKWNRKRTGKESSMSADVAIDWITRAEVDQICSDLEISEDMIEKERVAFSCFKSAVSTLSRISSNKLTQLAAFRASTSKKDVKECWQEYLLQAQSEPLPEDVFLLPSLPQLAPGAAVILLREIVSVPHNKVCYRTFDASSTEMFLRLGRLNPTFKYAVSQAFGGLYSRIGLPEEYENRCKEVICDISLLPWEEPCCQ